MDKHVKTTPVIIEDDGLDIYDDEEGYRSIIRGLGRVKFYDPNKWTLGNELIDPDREFLVGKILKVTQKWMPTTSYPETKILAPDEKFPDEKALNEAAPREEWREVFGQLKGPYENAYVVYLMDPKTGEVLTYVANTVGGRRAVRDLRESASMQRRMHGTSLVPVVTLSNTWMSTNYGGRERPALKIQRFEQIGEQPVAPEQLEQQARDDEGAADDVVEDADEKLSQPQKSARAALKNAKAKQAKAKK